jgi:hypothetical protein
METNIIKFEDNKIQVIEDNDVKEYELESWVKPEFVKKGPAEISLKDGRVSFVSMKEKSEKPKEATVKEPKKNWAEDMTNFEDLLNAGHEKGLISIDTEMISIDFEKKQAVFKATVKGKISEGIGEFTGYGDAEGITNETIKPHWIRMSESRAIVRALRFYTNNAQVAVEEIGK